MRKVFEIGGLVAAVVLVAFGVAAIALGVNGNNEVQTALKQQKLTGTPNMTPNVETAAAKKAGLNVSAIEMPTCDVAGKAVTEGKDARCFANYMRVDALMGTGGLVYSQMPRYASADGKGTNNEAEALKAGGQAVANPARNVWVTETALSTALNASYMAEQTALFGVVVGIALLLAGVGFAVLTIAGALRNPETALGFLRGRSIRRGHGGAPATSH
jgi:hypothetical protein